MEGKVPGGEPGIFPLVRHRDDVASQKVTPSTVAALFAAFGRRRLQRIPVEPFPHIEVIKLLAPQHPGKGLALYAARILVGNAFLQGSVEFIRLGNAPDEYVVESDERIRAMIAGA